MRFLYSIAIVLLTFSGSAATWYLDASSSGANNGTSWTDAWQNVTNVVWGASGVKAGDTLSISGGTYTNATFSIGASGNSSNWITIEASREVGHNSRVIIGLGTYNGNQWINIVGALDTNYSIPYPGVIRTNQAALTNNINMQFTHLDRGVTSQGLYISGAAGANQRISWVEFGPIAADVDTNAWDGFGLRFLNITTNGNFKVSACWFHDIKNDNINLNAITGTNPTNYDAMIVEHCWVQGGGDDGFQWARNGFTVRNNFFDGHLAGIYQGHPDHVQLSGVSQQYFKFINNIFNDNGNSIIKAEMLAQEGGILGDLIFVGNVCYGRREVTNYTFGEPIGFQAWRENTDTNVNLVTQKNCYFLNNTFYYLKAGSGLPWFIGRAVPTGGTRSAWVINATNGWFANNVGLDLRYNAINGDPALSWQGDGAGGGVNDTNGIYYATNAVRWINNSLSGTENGFKYFGQTWTNGEQLGMGNVSTTPSFVSTNTYDFRLLSTDTVATGTGYNWSTLDSLTNNHPELMLDVFGNPRFRSGVVDLGAVAQTTYGPDTNSLALWVRFSDDLTDGIATDSGPLANHGKHYGYVNDQVATNRFPSSINWTNPVTGLITNAAFFNRTNDGWGTYTISGDYVVFTNVPFRSTPNLSVSLWFYYQPHDTASATNYSSIANMRPLGGGYGYTGAWTLGLMGDQFTKLRVYTNDNANAESTIAWAGHRISTSGSFQGYSTNWAWVGFTWDNGTLVQYLNGVVVRTTNVAATVGLVTNLTVRAPAGGLTGGFFMVGGDSHNGNPNLTPFDDSGDQLPNHAWFTGGIADLMIYTRTLTTNEMWNNYAENWSTPSSGGGGGGGGSISGIRAAVQRATIGSITGP